MPAPRSARRACRAPACLKARCDPLQAKLSHRHRQAWPERSQVLLAPRAGHAPERVLASGSDARRRSAPDSTRLLPDGCLPVPEPDCSPMGSDLPDAVPRAAIRASACPAAVRAHHSRPLPPKQRSGWCRWGEAASAPRAWVVVPAGDHGVRSRAHASRRFRATRSPRRVAQESDSTVWLRVSALRVVQQEARSASARVHRCAWTRRLMRASDSSAPDLARCARGQRSARRVQPAEQTCA